MKKILTIVVILSMILGVGSSCSKDDKDDKTESLIGTTWIGWDADKIVKYTVVFLSESNVSITGLEVEWDYKQTISGKYTYNKTNIIITSEDGDAVTGTVNGDIMTLVAWGETLILTKY